MLASMFWQRPGADEAPWPPGGGPDGTDRDAFHARLTGPGRSVWMRQMVLGPAPEYAVRSGAPVALPYEARAIAATPL